MSESATAERTWGAKRMFNSAFRDLGHCIDVMLDRVPEGEFKAYLRCGAAMIKQAFFDAEDEVEEDPDCLGPEQIALLYPPTDDDEIDMIALFCKALDLDVRILRDTSSSILDRIAERVRAECTDVPSAEVICIAEARVRREAVREAHFSVPVMSRRGGRKIGDQFVFAFAMTG